MYSVNGKMSKLSFLSPFGKSKIDFFEIFRIRYWLETKSSMRPKTEES